MPTTDPTQMKKEAVALLSSGNYDPSGGVTKCNLFLHAYAQALWSYADLSGLSANRMILHLRGDASSATPKWEKIFDDTIPNPVAPAYLLGTPMKTAEARAASGHLVVIGLKLANTDQPSGHVMAVLPGALTVSGNWSSNLLAKLLPEVAQAGTSVFPKSESESKNVAYGLRATDVIGREFAIYYLL